MADPKQPDAPNDPPTEAGAEPEASEALEEEELASVAGGILIGMRQAPEKHLIAQKEIPLQPDLTPQAVPQDTVFKFFKK